MENPHEMASELIRLGRTFTYENFTSARTGYGYPEAYSADFVSWRADVINFISQLCLPSAAPTILLKSAMAVKVIHNGEDKFVSAMQFYMKALERTLQLLEKDHLGERVRSEREMAVGPLAVSNRVFVVHGHDTQAKQELEIMLAEMGLEPVVLHRQADSGKTLIEKFEHFADVGFAFILLTADELAYLSSEENKPDAERVKEKRARPNVIFEFGFFVGKLGRSRTCCLYKGGVTIPSDLNGIIYKSFNKSVEEVGYAIQKELRSAGYKIK